MSKEIITEIINDLERKNLIKWSKRCKITKEKLIECWSEYRIEPDWKWFGYSEAKSTYRAFKNLFFTYNKNNIRTWKNYILEKYGYKYCNNCKELKLLNDFSISTKQIDNRQDRCRICKSEYKHDNKDKCNNIAAKRRAALLQRIPSWFTKKDELKIQEIYKEAKRIELETGIKQHVDHIIPLQGKMISGLHIPENLQIITAEENLNKNNKFEIK